MRILLINNFSKENLVGGVENYLQALVSYAEDNNPEITFKWFGAVNTKTKITQKFYNYKTTKTIINEIDIFKPDLIHCFSIGAAVTPHFMKYAKRKSIPLIQSFRDYYYICPKGSMLNIDGNIVHDHKSFLNCIINHYPKKSFFYDILLTLKQRIHRKIIKQNINHFLTPSNNLTKLISHKFNIAGETLPNPVLISNTFLDKQESNYLLYVGRLEPEKGVLTLLKAFQKILENFPNEQLQIVGSGSDRSALENFVNKNEIQNVTFLGTQNRNELMHIYASAKFTIVPSEILESYGNVILESFAFNKTVIISNLLGIQNEIAQSKSGLVFPYGNVEKLQEAIEKLLIDIELKCDLEKNATRFVQGLSFENHFKKLLLIYKKVLAN
jgi:glycosyltransferase involved in cell wall biosynthesis